MSRAMAPAFGLVTFPGAMASALTQRISDAVFLPSVDQVESGERELPYPGLVVANALPFALLTLVGVGLFAFTVTLSGHRELLVIWLGVSLVVHAVPGEGATAAIHSRTLQTDSRWRWLGAALVSVANPLHRLRTVWLDLVYALALFGVVRWFVGWL